MKIEPGGEGRQDERQDDPPEGRDLPRAEIGAGLEERPRDALEAGVERQDHVRQPEVGEHDPDPEVDGYSPAGSSPNRPSVQSSAVRGQDDAPRVDPTR